MQRVEPANVRTFEEPVPAGRPTPTPTQREDTQTSIIAAFGPSAAERNAPPTPQGSGAIVFWSAFLFSGLWIAGIGAYVIGLVGVEKALTLSVEWYSLIGAATIVPIALTIFVAVLAREAGLLRQQSVSLAAAAAHLVEPEETAAKNMGRLSKAIRRELDTFNVALEAAAGKMAALEAAANERLALIERTAAAAQERVERATNRLGSEREKLAQFTQALDTVVLAASETLTTRLKDARAAARSASESLHAEHGAIAGLISTLQSASHAVSTKALETGKEIERQAQRLDAASEAATARSEQVVARHERQRSALADTIDRLKQENDHMARALDYQREGMNKLVASMADENKKIGTFTVEGARRLDDAASLMAQRIVETTQLFSREAEKLRTSTDLTTSGLEQAMQTIRTASDSSFDAAGRLGSVLLGLRDTATSSSQQIEGTVSHLSKLLNDMPAESAAHVHNLRVMIEQQSEAMRDLHAKVGAAFDRVQAIEMTRAPAPARPALITQIQAPQQGQHYSPPRLPLQHTQLPAPPQHPQIPQYPTHSQHVRPQQFPIAGPDAGAHLRDHHLPPASQPIRETPPASPRHGVPHFRAPPMADDGIPNFTVPPAGSHLPLPGYSQARSPQPIDRSAQPPESGEPRGWLGMAKRLVRPNSDDGDGPLEDRGKWDLKSLLAAAENTDSEDGTLHAIHPSTQLHRAGPTELPRQVRSGQFQPPPPPRQLPPVQQRPQNVPGIQQTRQNSQNAADHSGAAHTSSRHMIETLQAMAIDLSRFLEDDPPVDLLRRYRNGERNVFARRLASTLTAEHVLVVGRKYREDREFRDTVNKYVQQFESLLEQTARSDKENVLVETYLTSQTGKVYVTLASAIGRLS